MKNILLNIIVFCPFLISPLATANPNTEAQAPCFNCLVGQYPLKSIAEVEKLCMQSLPAYCKDIKAEYTRCSAEYHHHIHGGIPRLMDVTVGKPAFGCAMGVYDGATDLFTGAVNMIKGAGKFVVDSAYRKEALNTMSYMAASVAGASTSDVKDFFVNPVLGYVDEFTTCLNPAGKIHYLCEGGTQLFLPLAGVKAVTKARKAAKKLMANPYVKTLNPKLVDKLPTKTKQNFYNRLNELNKNTKAIQANTAFINRNRITIARNAVKTAKVKDMASLVQYSKAADTIRKNTAKIKNNKAQMTEMKTSIQIAQRELDNVKGSGTADGLNDAINKFNNIEKTMLSKMKKLEIQNKALEGNISQLSKQNTALVNAADDAKKFIANAKLVQQSQQLRTTNQGLIAKNTDIATRNNQLYSELDHIVQQNKASIGKNTPVLSEKLRNLQNADNALFNQTKAILLEST